MLDPTLEVPRCTQKNALLSPELAWSRRWGKQLRQLGPNWSKGKAVSGRLHIFDTETHPVKIAGEVQTFEPGRHITPKSLKRMDRFIQFALVAALDAVNDAGLTTPVHKRRAGWGTRWCGTRGLQTIEDALKVLDTKGAKRLSPFMLPKLISNLAPGYISMAIGSKGPEFQPGERLCDRGTCGW